MSPGAAAKNKRADRHDGQPFHTVSVRKVPRPAVLFFMVLDWQPA